MWDFNAFFQDDIKINSRLTVNFGVRWEYDGLPSDINGAFSSIWPSLMQAGPVPGNSPANGTLLGFVVPANYKGPIPAGVTQNIHDTPARNTPPLDNFAPRLGFAWQPLENNSRWVVRAGGGYFYDPRSRRRHSGSLQRTAVRNFAHPFADVDVGESVQHSSDGARSSGDARIHAAVDQLCQQHQLEHQQSVGRGSLADAADVRMEPEHRIRIQADLVFSLGYVGSRGIHEPYGNATVYYNAAPLASATNPIHCGYDGNAADCITTSTAANVPSRVPNLGMSAQATQAAAAGDYKFNGLQATLRKQFSHGLQLEGSYSWSRAFEAQQFGIPAASGSGSVCCVGPGYVYGLNPIYRPQRFVINYVWNVPVFGHPNGFERRLVDGWSVSGVTIIQDGTPLNITDTRGGAAYGLSGLSLSTAQYAAGMGPGDVATGGSLDSRVRGRYLNRQLSPPSWRGRRRFYGLRRRRSRHRARPGQNNFDISLAKNTVVGGIHEGAALQFRAEFFNAFNHPQFSNPVTNFASAAFGQITSTSVNPRLIQFALKYNF